MAWATVRPPISATARRCATALAGGGVTSNRNSCCPPRAGSLKGWLGRRLIPRDVVARGQLGRFVERERRSGDVAWYFCTRTRECRLDGIDAEAGAVERGKLHLHAFAGEDTVTVRRRVEPKPGALR